MEEIRPLPLSHPILQNHDFTGELGRMVLLRYLTPILLQPTLSKSICTRQMTPHWTYSLELVALNDSATSCYGNVIKIPKYSSFSVFGQISV